MLRRAGREKTCGNTHLGNDEEGKQEGGEEV